MTAVHWRYPGIRFLIEKGYIFGIKACNKCIINCVCNDEDYMIIQLHLYSKSWGLHNLYEKEPLTF